MAVTERTLAMCADQEPAAVRAGWLRNQQGTLTLLPDVPRAVRVDELAFLEPVRDARRSEQRVTALTREHESWGPILVHRTTRIVIDGRLRVTAARRLGISQLPVVWFEGDPKDVMVEFVRCNCGEQYGLTPDERQEAARHVLHAHPEWADRRIGDLCAVSPKTVAQVRSRSTERNELNTDQPLERRVGRDGRSRPVDAAAQRDKVAEALREDPTASLRTIAGRVGVSPETVRRVRSAMRELNQIDRLGPPPPEMFEAIYGRSRPEPWRGDQSFQSQEASATTAEFLERTDVTDADIGVHAGSVPLSRVYEVADEARRRAAFWARLAECVEGRARHNGR